MSSFLNRLLHKTNNKFPFCTAVVAAAGSARRMDGEEKLLLPLRGTPVLAHALLALEGCPEIQEIIVVTRSDLIPAVGLLCREHGIKKATKVVVGGAERHHSVLLGVRAADTRAQLIAVQDGARPLTTPDLISTALRAADQFGAAAPAVPVKDTIKVVRDGLAVETPNRNTLFAVQTPQVFEVSLLRTALIQATESGETPTDDCAAVERLGVSVIMTEGSYENIKITTPVDLLIAEAILDRRETNA